MTQDKKPEAAKTVEPKAKIVDATKAATFAAYLMIALPANMAMAANWQTPAQLAALNSGISEPQATSITVSTTTIQPAAYFQVTYADVADEVALQLAAQGVEKKARATTMPANSPVLYSADHPLKLTLHALQIDPQTRQWQAQAHIMGQGKTEAVKPISGHYEGIVTVPVLTRQLRAGDIIEQADLTSRDLPGRSLRKDTITDISALLGKSPRGTISGARPIRTSEISAPVVIKKGELVDLSYTTPHISIKTNGVALEDGELGGAMRVKNEKTEKSITGRVISAGKVEVNMEAGS